MASASAAPTDHALALLKGLYSVADLVFSDIGGILSEFDLTESQATMLWALEPSTPPISMRQLAAKLRCDPSNISLLGDQLEAAGLAERQTDPDDGRRRVLRLTEKGLEAWSLLLERIQMRAPLFSILSAAEQRQLSALLQKVDSGMPA